MKILAGFARDVEISHLPDEGDDVVEIHVMSDADGAVPRLVRLGRPHPLLQLVERREAPGLAAVLLADHRRRDLVLLGVVAGLRQQGVVV